MDSCQYEEAPNEDKSGSADEKKFKWKPFLRQMLVCTGVWIAMFLHGLCIGAPTVLIPQLRKETNSTIVVTDDMASWLTSLYSFGGFPFVIILSIATKLFGRKRILMIAVADNIAAYVLLYYSSNMTHIVISQIMLGIFTGSNTIVTILIIGEYTSPTYRGVFLTIKLVTLYWGIWASNLIGTFFHWKFIPIFGIICGLFTFITIIMWPESPYWLASKGRFEECAASHRWLKGCDETSEKELEKLIKTQNEYIAYEDSKDLVTKNRIIGFLTTIKAKEFYKATLLAFSTSVLGALSGKFVCAVYILDIIKNVTNSESTAYTGMLILDGITILSMYLGCILAKYLNRRTLLLTASSMCAIFLFTISLYIYLISLGIITNNKYVFMFLLTAYSIAVSCGPILMGVAVYAELIPVRSRNLAVCYIALSIKLTHALTLKISPLVFKQLGMHGLFLIFGIFSMVLTLCLYKYLPETKNKTLQEIADSIVGVRKKEIYETADLLINK